MPTQPWRNWYHCTVGTYAQWLPGDPRGWRERNHHEHVIGDYKSPPPRTKFATGMHEHAKRLMREEPYQISFTDRKPIGQLLLQSFAIQEISVLALAVSANNFHVLLQASDQRPKKILGQAKLHVIFRFAPIINSTTNQRRRIWETGGAAKLIRDRQHAVNTFKYILEHVNEEAWVWSFRDINQKGSALPRTDGVGGL